MITRAHAVVLLRRVVHSSGLYLSLSVVRTTRRNISRNVSSYCKANKETKYSTLCGYLSTTTAATSSTTISSRTTDSRFRRSTCSSAVDVSEMDNSNSNDKSSSDEVTTTTKKKKSSSIGIKDDALFVWDDNNSNDSAEIKLIDIGANLADSCFNTDRTEVLIRASKFGRVCGIVMTGTSIQQSERALYIAQEYQCQSLTNMSIDDKSNANNDNPIIMMPRVYATAGVHPHDVKALEPPTTSTDNDSHHTSITDTLSELIKHPYCVAVGETGLDFNRDFSPREVQKKWFETQVRLAVQFKKPLFVHCREANAELCEILQRVARETNDNDTLSVPVVVHCFTGTVDEAQQLLDLGCYIGFTGWICDEREGRAEQMAQVIELVPDDKIMIETDAPYLPPRSITPSKLRPRRNEPCLLPHVLHKVAEVKGQSLNTVAANTTRNALRFFNIEI